MIQEKIKLPLIPSEEHLRLFLCTHCDAINKFDPESLDEVRGYSDYRTLNCHTCGTEYALSPQAMAANLEDAYKISIMFLKQSIEANFMELERLRETQEKVLARIPAFQKRERIANTLIYSVEKWVDEIINALPEDAKEAFKECEETLDWIESIKSKEMASEQVEK